MYYTIDFIISLQLFCHIIILIYNFYTNKSLLDFKNKNCLVDVKVFDFIKSIICNNKKYFILTYLQIIRLQVKYKYIGYTTICVFFLQGWSV